MSFALLLGIALLGASLVFANWYANAQPSFLATLARYAGAGLAGTLGLILVARGQFGLGLVLLGSAGALLFRRPAGGPRKTTSEIETPFLRMRLDHETGDLAGEVLAGQFEGRLLAGLGENELATLRTELDGDAESVRLLETYIERMRSREAGAQGAGTDDQTGASDGGAFGSGSSPMTRGEALEILGLSGSPSEAEIRHAHRTLIRGVHPDHGGSSYLAAKLNAARDLLLAEKH